MIPTSVFGRTADGKNVLAFRIKDGANEAVILSMGGIIQSLRIADRHGYPVDVVLGYNDVASYEQNGGYHPMDIFNNDQDIRHVLMQLINGYYSPQDPELFRDIYDSLLNTNSSDRADTYFILKDFRSYAEAHKRVEEAYRDEKGWAKKAIWNTACSGKFSSDRTIQQYVDEIWHLDKMTVTLPKQ